MNELEKVAQEEERRPEAFEKKRMGGEDVQSRNRQAWDRIFQSVPNPFSMVQVAGEIDSLFDANGPDDRGKGNDRRKTERTLNGLGRTRTTLRPPGGKGKKKGDW